MIPRLPQAAAYRHPAHRHHSSISRIEQLLLNILYIRQIEFQAPLQALRVKSTPGATPLPFAAISETHIESPIPSPGWLLVGELALPAKGVRLHRPGAVYRQSTRTAFRLGFASRGDLRACGRARVEGSMDSTCSLAPDGRCTFVPRIQSEQCHPVSPASPLELMTHASSSTPR